MGVECSAVKSIRFRDVRLQALGAGGEVSGRRGWAHQFKEAPIDFPGLVRDGEHLARFTVHYSKRTLVRKPPQLSTCFTLLLRGK